MKQEQVNMEKKGNETFNRLHSRMVIMKDSNDLKKLSKRILRHCSTEEQKDEEKRKFKGKGGWI